MRALRITAYVLLATFVILVNVGVGGFLFLKTNRARNLLLGFGLKKLQPVFPGGALVGSSEGDLTKRVVLHDVELRDLDGRPAVKIDRVELKYSLLPLLLTRVQVDLVRVDGVTITSQPLADGRDNLATMAVIPKPLPKPPRVLPVSVVLQELDVQARFVRPGNADVRADIHARAQLSHGMVASLDELTIDVVKPAHAQINVQGGLHITPEPDQMEIRRLDVRITGDTTELRRRVDKLQLSGPVLIAMTADGRVQDLTATFAADTTQPKVRVRAAAHVFADRAQLHSLSVRSPFATVDAHGVYHFDQTGEGNVHVDAPDLRPLALFGAPPISGSVKLDASAERQDGHVTAHANGLVRDLVVAQNHVGKVVVDVDTQDLSGHAFIDATNILAGGVALNIAKVNASGDKTGMRVGVDAHGPEGLDLALSAGATTHMNGKKLVAIDATLDAFKLRAGGTPWKLDAPAHFTANFEKALYALAPLGLNNDKQHITVEGRLDRDDLQAVHLDIKHFDLSQLPALLSPGHVLPVTDLQASAEATGPMSEPDAGMKFEGVGDGRTQHDLIHLSTNGSARLQHGRLNAKVFATIGGQKTSAKLDIPFPLRPDEPIDASVDASVLLNVWFADLLVPKFIQSQPIIMYSLGAKVTAQGSLTGTTSHPKMNAAARVARWGADNAHGELAASVAYEDRQLRASSTLTLSKLPLGGGKGAGVVQATAMLPIDLGRALSGSHEPLLDTHAAWTGSLDLKHVDIDKLPFEGFDVAPFIRHGWVDATAQLAGSDEDPKVSVKFDARDLDVAGVAQVALLGSATVDGSKTTASVKVSVRGDEALRVQGSIDEHPRNVTWRHAPLAASVDTSGFDLTKLQLFKELAGTLKGSAKVSGTWDKPRVVATASAPGLRSGQTTYDKLDLSAELVDAKLSTTLRAAQNDGSSLDASLVTQRGAITGALDAKRFRVDMVSELLPTIRAMHAQLDGNVHIAGTIDRPKLDGTLAVTNGDLTLSQTAITYKDMRATLAFAGDAIAVHDFKMDAGTGGSMDGDARVTLRALRPDAILGTLALRHYPVEWADTSGVADVSLRLDGRRDKAGGFATLVSVENGHVELSDDRSIHGLIPTAHLEDVKVGKARPEPIAAPTPQPKTGARDGKHYTVDFKGPFSVHGRELDAQAQADVRVDLSSDIPTATGALTLGHGNVRLFGQRYDLVRGRVLFGNIAQPNLDFRVARGVSRARIGVDVGGSALQPTTTFWSQPPEAYAQAQVAGMVTGQRVEKDGVEKKGLDKKVEGPLSNLIAVSFRQNDPASATADVTKRQPIPDASKNKQ